MFVRLIANSDDRDIDEAPEESDPFHELATGEQGDEEGNCREGQKGDHRGGKFLEQADADDPMGGQHDQNKHAAHDGECANASSFALEEKFFGSSFSQRLGHVASLAFCDRSSYAQAFEDLSGAGRAEAA